MKTTGRGAEGFRLDLLLSRSKWRHSELLSVAVERTSDPSEPTSEDGECWKDSDRG